MPTEPRIRSRMNTRTKLSATWELRQQPNVITVTAAVKKICPNDRNIERFNGWLQYTKEPVVQEHYNN